MFRRAKKLLYASRERILSLVLLPAFFLATIPHTACICADGHREAFCRATLCRFMSAKGSESACCGCSCCKAGAKCEKRSCCKNQQGQAKSTGAASGTGMIANANSC